MTITGIAGAIGTGKSLMQLAFACEQANKKRKKLVLNFAIDFRQLRIYCGMMGYHYLGWLLDEGQVIVIDALDNLTDLLVYPDSVCCLDEAGIFLNARDFQKTPKKLLLDLCQSRKGGVDLVWAAQFDSQVDKQFRQLTQYWVHSFGISTYDLRMRRTKLVYKLYYYFNAEQYDLWLTDTKARASYFRTRFKYAFRTQQGFLKKEDRQLFNAFDSFARLEQQKEYSRTAQSRYFCNLPPDYYFDKPGYDPTTDPLRGDLIPKKLQPIKVNLHEVVMNLIQS